MIFSWDVFQEDKEEELATSREKLLDILFNYQAFTGEKMIVVFDGYKSKIILVQYTHVRIWR